MNIKVWYEIQFKYILEQNSRFKTVNEKFLKNTNLLSLSKKTN